MSAAAVIARTGVTARRWRGAPVSAPRARAGQRVALAFIIVASYNVVFAALVVRVVASWFGRFRYTWWLRPAYVLTDWVVEPIRRLLPAGGAGGLDWSPLAAWLVLWVLKRVLLTIILG